MTPLRANLSLRRAGADDQQTVLDYLSDFYAESGFKLDKSKASHAIGQLIANDHFGRLFLIDVDGGTVGYIALTFGFSLEFDGRDGIIDDLYVAPAHRDQGIGSRVVDLVTDEARKQGLQAVHLEVEHDNERAKKVYFRAGFKDYKRHLLSCRLNDDNEKRSR